MATTLPVDLVASSDPVGAGGGPTADDTRVRLVQAAVDVFAEKGYDGAGVAEIARRAGLTTGAIYSRFSGKAELLLEAIRSSTTDEFDRLFAEHRFQGRATDLLEAVGEHLVTRRADPGRSVLLEAFVAARRDPEVAAMLRDHLEERAQRLSLMIDETKAAGLVATDLDTAAIAHFAHAVGLGFLLFEAVGSTHPTAESWSHLLHRVIGAVADPTGHFQVPDPNDPNSATSAPSKEP